MKEFDYSVLGNVADKVAAASAKYDHLLVLTKVSTKDSPMPPGGLTFTIARPTGTIVLRTLEDGTISLPADAQLRAQNPKVSANVPKETKLNLKIELQFRPQPEQTFSYAEIETAVAQTNALVAEQAGAFSWFAPSVKGVKIRCGSDCAVSFSDAKGAPIAAGKDGFVRFPIRSNASNVNVTVSLSRPAQTVSPDFD